MTNAGEYDRIDWQYHREKGGAQIAERNNNRNFVALGVAAQWLIFFGHPERNKIKILLRSGWLCAILFIYIYKDSRFHL